MTDVAGSPAGAATVARRAMLAALAAYLLPQRPRVALLAGLLLASIGLDLVNPQVLRSFIDTAAAGGALSTLVTMALVFLGVALTAQLVGVVETYTAETVGLTATNRLRADLTRHVLRLDPSFHAAHPPGELIERVDGDVTTLGNFFSRFVVHLFGNGLLLLAVLVLFFGIDWRVGLVMSAFVAITLVVMLRLRDVGVPYWDATRQATARVYGFIEERLAGTEDIRANGAVAETLRGLLVRGRDLFWKHLRSSIAGNVVWNGTTLLFAIGGAVSLGLGAYLYGEGGVTIGTVYLIFAYTQLLNRPIEAITRQMQDLQQATASLGRVQRLLGERSAIDDGPGTPVPDGPLSVEIDGVSFGYAADTPVLRDVTLRIAPGEVVGLLGRTGSGKTTLTRLLFRLYDPTAGTIRLGGVDPRDARIADVRRHVGMVTQEIHLFHANVRDNLTFFDRSIGDARILDVLDELGLADWLRGLPAGLDTRLAPGGGGLSAGEGQLLALTRVFLKDPGLVILDEASSRLDPATEHRLERAVDKLLRGRTGIIIAHRLGTVERADTIVLLEEGRLAEHGPRAALAADPTSRFAGLLRTGLAEALA